MTPPEHGAAVRAASRARRIGRGTVPQPVTVRRPRPDAGSDQREHSGAENTHTRSARRKPRTERKPRAERKLRAERRVAGPGWTLVAVAAVLMVALALADVALWPGRHHGPARAELRERLLASVDAGIVAVLSYDYRHLDEDAGAAEAHLTGAYRDDYSAAMIKTIKPTAPRVKAVVQGAIGSSAVASVTRDGSQATVLIFGQQTVTNAAQRTPRYDMVSLRVTAQLVRGTWLIAKLDQL